jgi:microcystin-dependent protein
MGTPFLGEIKIVSFGFAPRSWALCNGQLLPINQNQALFSLLGTQYGGNGQTTFALPDLRGQTPIHVGAGFLIGNKGGEQAHTVTMSEMPTHVHVAQGNSATADLTDPTGALLASPVAAVGPIYTPNPAGLVAMSPASVSNVGGSQAHINMQPYLTLNFCIALQGIFPSRN